MIYRPQFAYPTPDGCRDVDYVYYFDGSNTPLLNQNVSGLNIPNIPLTLEQDVPFYWRGIKVNADRQQSAGVPHLYSVPNFKVRFDDWSWNKLSDDFVPATLYGYPSNAWQFNNAQLTGPPVPIQEIYCPAGSVQWLNLQVPTLSGDSHFVSVSLHGVKRYKECL